MLGRLLGVLCRKPVPRGDVRSVTACRVTWHYDHPAEVMLRAQEADTRAFQRWIVASPEIDADAISRRELVSLYAEFCDLHELRPMSWGRFDRSLRGAGFQRVRSSRPCRPWLYQAIRPGSALIYKLPPTKAPAQPARAAA